MRRYLNVGKAKVMTTGDIGEMTVDGKDIEVVTKLVFLGALITKDGLCEKEMRRRIAMGKAEMGGLTSIWKDRGVTMDTKMKLVKVLVFPIVLYGAETWKMRKHERRKIDAFELWCWRRVLRVSSSLGSRCVPWLGEGFSMSSPYYPVLCCPLPYRVAPVSVQVVSPPLGWSPLSSFLVIWSLARGPSVIFDDG